MERHAAIEQRRIALFRRGLFFPVFALSACAAMLTGFAFTYFGPVLAGAYPPVSPAVHLHGWSFFLWYLLLPAQAMLVGGGQLELHRAIGRSSVVLAVVMFATAILVLAVRLRDAMAGARDPFSITLLDYGPLLLVDNLLFGGFYTAAVVAAHRFRIAEHKRYIVLAASFGLGAALFRIIQAALGPDLWQIGAGVIATAGFVVPGMIHDRVTRGAVHPIYWSGLAIGLGLMVVVMPFPANPAVQLINEGLAGLGEALAFLY